MPPGRPGSCCSNYVRAAFDRPCSCTKAHGAGEWTDSTARAARCRARRVSSPSVTGDGASVRRPASAKDRVAGSGFGVRAGVNHSLRGYERAKSGIGKSTGGGLAANAHTGSTTLLTIHACLPTRRPGVNPYCSKSSTVALNRNGPAPRGRWSPRRWPR